MDYDIPLNFQGVSCRSTTCFGISASRLSVRGEIDFKLASTNPVTEIRIRSVPELSARMCYGRNRCIRLTSIRRRPVSPLRVGRIEISLVSRTMSRRGSRNPPQISSAFTSTAVIPFPGGNFANPANPISEDTERLPGLNERGGRDGARFCDRRWKHLRAPRV